MPLMHLIWLAKFARMGKMPMLLRPERSGSAPVRAQWKTFNKKCATYDIQCMILATLYPQCPKTHIRMTGGTLPLSLGLFQTVRVNRTCEYGEVGAEG